MRSRHHTEDHHLIFMGGLLAIILACTIVFFPPRSAGAGQPVSYAVLEQGQESVVASRVNYLIASPDQFSQLWQMIHGASSTPPVVDFSANQVIAVFQGAEPSAGYGINVASILANSARRLVSIEVAAPAAGCATAAVATAPYEVVVVPASSVPLVHEDIPATTSCGR